MAFLNLIAEISRTGLTRKEFAKKVKINEVVLSRKLNSQVLFKMDEIKRILEFFELKLSFDYLFEETEAEHVA